MDFLKAVQNGHYEAVRSALPRIDVDYQDEKGANSALHVAVGSKRNKTKLIELLIGAGADCDLKNRDGLTASELALEAGSRSVAEFMVRKEFEGVPDDRAVYRLVRRGSVELLKIYLEKRAFDIHTKMKLIGRVVDELRVKGVGIGAQMKVFLEYQLVEYGYRYATRRKMVDCAGGGDQEAERRVELIVSYTKYLKENYDEDDLNDLDDRFVLRLRMICECCVFLEDIERRRERKLYDHIPLGEITYLMGIFLAILEKHVGFEIYKLVINKNMIMSYLGAVSEELRVATFGKGDGGDRRQFQWTLQLFVDLIGCIREERLLRYVARRKRFNGKLRRIATLDETTQLTAEDHEALQAEIRRKDFQEGVVTLDEFVQCLRDSTGEERWTIATLWHRRHPKLRLQKRQVRFVAGRHELAKIRTRTTEELSKNKTKLLEREMNSREFQSLGSAVGRRNRAIFSRIRKSFDAIKQMYMVKKIAFYVENAIVIDMDDLANETLCVLSIKRVLHLIGESIKASEQLPKAFVRMLENVLDHVLLPVESTSKIKDIRDFFSQKYSLGKYFASKTLDMSQYKLMQDNLRSVYRFFLYVINIQLIEAYKTFLGTAYRLRNISQIKSYAKYIGDHNLHTLSHIKFDHVFYNEDETDEIIQELKRMYSGMSNELKLLSFIEKNIHFRFYHMQYHQTRLRVTLSNFSIVYRALRSNPCYDSIHKLLYSYLHQSYQKYDISKSISISDSTLALKELLRPYSRVGESDENLMVVKHLEQLQELMDPDRLFGINPVRCKSRVPEAGKYHTFTRKILKEMGLQLGEEDFNHLHDKLRRTYYENIFLLQNRYKVMQEFFRQRGIPVDPKVLASYRERDEEQLQELFDAKVNDVIGILEKFECSSVDSIMESLGELPTFVEIALEFGLLELLEILVSVNALGNNLSTLRGSAPVLSGRNLKGHLTQDSLVVDLLVFNSNATIFLNAMIVSRAGFKLYGGGGGGVHIQDAPQELVGFEDRFKERWKWFEMQEILYESVRKGDLELLRENVGNGSDLRGKRFGPLVLKELCHYSLIDCAIAGSFRDMIAMLNRDFDEVNEERKRLLEYLLRRTIRSHFLVEQYCKLSPEDRKMLVLYLCTFLGDVDVFLENLKRYDAWDDLHLFVNSENHEFVTAVIGRLSGFDFNSCDSNGLTILHKVVNAGNLQAVSALCQIKEVDLNALCSLKYSALNLACRLNLVDIARALVKAEADMNVMSEDEKLPVFWLIQYQNPREIVSLAIDSSTELTAFSSELCLLHKAIEFDNLDVVRYLIEDQKVDPARIYSSCNNVIHAAACYNRSQILRYLLTYPGIRKLLNNTNLVKNTPLNIACKEGFLTIAKMLLKHGVCTDTCGEYGLNALAFAMFTNSFKLMKLLFKYGAKISYPLCSDFQPMNMAILNRNIPMLKYLLRRVEIDPNSAPLCFINAVYSRCREMVRILVAAGAHHINYKDEFCQTALHLCVERNEFDIARELIRCGADVNAKNRSGTTPLHLAVTLGNIRFVQLLLDSKCSVDELNYNGETALIKSVVCNNLEIVKMLLNNGASVERLRNSDPPVLLYLVQENSEEILDYLLEHYRFNPNEQDAYGNSLLYVATQHNHINIVKLLVDKYGAKTNPVNNKKLTPLMIARVREYKEIFSFLEARVAEE